MCITARTLDESSHCHCLSAPRPPPPPPCRPPLPHPLHLVVALVVVVVVLAVVALPTAHAHAHASSPACIPVQPSLTLLAWRHSGQAQHIVHGASNHNHNHNNITTQTPSHCRPSLVGRPAPNYTPRITRAARPSSSAEQEQARCRSPSTAHAQRRAAQGRACSLASRAHWRAGKRRPIGRDR